MVKTLAKSGSNFKASGHDNQKTTDWADFWTYFDPRRNFAENLKKIKMWHVGKQHNVQSTQ